MIATSFVFVALLLNPSDNNVQWGGVSHVTWLDRRPVCPVDGESFDVLFQTYQFDITSASVVVDDGGTTSYPATWIEDRGPYAVWSATVPATTSTEISYYIELTDGTDTDYYSASGMLEDLPTDGGFVINYDTLSHAPYGSTLVTGGAVFRVWAMNPTSAFVAGEFNGWNSTANEMTRLDNDFVAFVPGATDRQMYKYVFQPNSIWKPDAQAKSLNPSDNYNTHIEDRFRYAWNSVNFVPPAFEDMIIYELHVGTFSGRNDPVASGSLPGTYADVAAHVDHLVELGINVVEVMPVTEFQMDFSAGYNPITAYSPEWIYGDPDDLRYMVDVLHANGIAVIADIVWNHFGYGDNYLWDYDGTNRYFDDPFDANDPVDTPWGSQADFDYDPIRRYFVDSTLYWLDDMNIDGFRMDATEYMDIQGGGWSLMQWFNNSIDNRAVNKISIAEQLPDDPWITRPTSLGGAGFDAQWNDYFTDTLREEILDAGWDQGSVEMSKIADILDGSGTYLSQAQVVNYLELHDEIWPSSGGQRLVKTIDSSYPHDDIYAKGRIKLAQGLVMFAQGIPMFIQGSEWLEYTDFGGGQSDGSDRINWDLKTTYAPIFQYFSDICHTRTSNGALRANAGIDVFHVNDSGNVLAYHRWDLSGNDIVIVANFSNDDYYSYQLGLPQAGTWYELINSQAAVYDGNNVGNGGSVDTTGGSYDGFDQSAYITIPQMGLLVLRYNDPPTPDCPEDFDNDGQITLADLQILLANYGTMGGSAYTDGDVTGDGNVDLADLQQLLSKYGSNC